MLLQESSPFVIQERSVGLQVIFDALIGLLVLLLELNNFFEELQSK